MNDIDPKVKAAIDQARDVFTGTKDGVQALDYLVEVLKVAPARTEITAATCDLKIKVDTTALDAALALAEKLNEMIVSWAPVFAAVNARTASAMSATGEKAAAALRAESALLVADAERTTGQAGRTRIDPMGDLSREVRMLSGRLDLRDEVVAQLLVLAELRGIRAEQALDRFSRGAAVLSSVMSTREPCLTAHS